MRSFLIPINYYPYYRLPNAGEVNLLNAQAQVEYEEARKQNMLNQLLWTEIFFKMRELNREHRKKEKDAIQKPLTKERIKELAKKRLPRELSVEEFNKQTGEIKYPLVLTDIIFDEERELVNIKVKEYCILEEKTFQPYEQAEKAIHSLQEKLIENVKKYDSGMYAKATSFLKSLQYHIRHLI